MNHDVSRGGPDRGEPNGVEMDRFRDAERPVRAGELVSFPVVHVGPVSPGPVG